MLDKYQSAVEDAKEEFKRLHDCGALPNALFSMFAASRLGVWEDDFDWKILIKKEKDDFDAFDALRRYCAHLIRSGKPMPSKLKNWSASVLEGTLPPPKRRKGRPNSEPEFRDFLAHLIYFVSHKNELHPTRNVTSKPQSGCDAVSEAMLTFEEAWGLKPNSYDELAKIFGEANKLGIFVS